MVEDGNIAKGDREPSIVLYGTDICDFGTQMEVLQCSNERHLLGRCRDYETALVVGLRIYYMYEEAGAARLISMGCAY
jgi:hypothetical protein